MKHYGGDQCEHGEVDRRTAISHLLWTWEFRAMIGLQVFAVIVLIVAIITGRFP